MAPHSWKYFAQDWCGLRWTKWVRFDSSPQGFRLIVPSEPGLYRVRQVGSKNLVYIGQTGNSLRTRLNTLRTYTFQDVMPFNDPHTAAPNLWAWRVENHMEYECSATPQNLNKQHREGLECFLLWQYRRERGQSTLCNHGWFHPDYHKSGSRETQKRGRKRTQGKGKRGLSIPPLTSNNLSSGYWGWSIGIPLTPKGIETYFQSETEICGLYKLFNKTTSKILYIGQSTTLKNRMLAHAKKDWAGQKLNFSVHHIALESMGKYPQQLAELENDLIGIFYNQFTQVPAFQFKGHT